MTAADIFKILIAESDSNGSRGYMLGHVFKKIYTMLGPFKSDVTGLGREGFAKSVTNSDKGGRG